MKRWFLFPALCSSVVAIVATTLLACEAKPLADDSASAGPKEDGPAIPAEYVGESCAGLGGSPGTIVGMASDSCPGGACVLDLRTSSGNIKDFLKQSYCTADCNGHTCPSGTSCERLQQVVDGLEFVCVKTDEWTDPATSADEDASSASTGATNPYGAEYPTSNIGWKPRTTSKPGNRIANLTFQGYAADSTALSTVSLADFFDPEGRTHDVLVILGNGIWASASQAAMKALKSASTRAKTLSVLGQGPTQKAATLSDLSSWRKTYPWAAHGLDADFKQLLPAFGQLEALPFEIIVDAETMEICFLGEGANVTADAFNQEIEACHP